MGSQNSRRVARLKRKRRIRKRVFGTSERPRLSVFRSTKHIYAQVISDARGETLAAASSLEEDVKSMAPFGNKIEQAAHIGKLVAQRALDKGIKQVVFDRNGYMYHGRVKAVSEGARESGLSF